MEGHQPEMAEAFGPECDREVVGKWLLDLNVVGAVESQEQGIFTDLCWYCFIFLKGEMLPLFLKSSLEV